jgi:hypothetical protein
MRGVLCTRIIHFPSQHEVSGENSTSQECRRAMSLRMTHDALYETSIRLQDIINCSPTLKTERPVTSENFRT